MKLIYFLIIHEYRKEMDWIGASAPASPRLIYLEREFQKYFGREILVGDIYGWKP